MIRILFLLLLSLSGISHLIGQVNVVETLFFQNIQRNYIVHLPPGYSFDQAVPLVIVLHGGSGTYQNVQGFTQMNPVSNANGFLVVYPQGAGIAPPGFSWADGRGTSADLDGIDDVGFIDRLIDTLAQDYLIDLDRIYVCGFSNGGFMTQRLGCELADRFAAIGSLGCSMDTSLYAHCMPSRPVPMLFMNGTADPFVPYGGGVMNGNVTPIVPVDTAVAFWVDHNQCQTIGDWQPLPDVVTDDNSTAEVRDFTDCACQADVRFYRMINGGHTWPGVELPSQEPLLGETNEDIQASQALWTFFAAHPFCTTSSTTPVGDSHLPVTIFPNPVRHLLTVSATRAIRELAVVDWSGRTCGVGDAGDHQVDVSRLAPGYYFLRVVFQSGQVHIQPFVVY